MEENEGEEVQEAFEDADDSTDGAVLINGNGGEEQ